MHTRFHLTVTLVLMSLPAMVLAEDGHELSVANTAWVLTATTLPVLALFYGGLVPTKNVLAVLMQCFAITCAVTVTWVASG